MNNSSELVVSELRPIVLNLYQIVTHIICLVIGIPVNIIGAVILILSRRLHKVRNALWLGIIACNLMSLFMALIELVAVLGTNELACMIYSCLVVKPNIVHLIYVLMATADRYVYMSRPLVHKKYLNVKLVNLTQVMVMVFSFIFLMSPYWTGLVPIRCGLDQRVNKWLPLIGFFLIIACIAAQIAVYLQARYYLAISARSRPAIRCISQEISANGDVVLSDDRPSFFALIGDRRMSRSELEATVILVAGVVLLAVFVLPSYMLIFAIWICDQVSPGRCAAIIGSTPYIRQLILFHSVLNLSIYITQSREFVSTLRDMWRYRCLCPSIGSVNQVDD